MTETIVKYSVAITTVGGFTLTVEDGENGAYGTAALAGFNAKDTLACHTDSGITYIPFHAVDYIEVTATTETATITDANCED